MKFKDVKIGEQFYNNGCHCTKKSSRTAYIDGLTKRKWFYFGQYENVGLIKETKS